jgi:hypothetical protein
MKYNVLSINVTILPHSMCSNANKTKEQLKEIRTTIRTDNAIKIETIKSKNKKIKCKWFNNSIICKNNSMYRYP